MKKRIGAALLSFAMLAALFVPSVIPARAEADNTITPVLTTTSEPTATVTAAPGETAAPTTTVTVAPGETAVPTTTVTVAPGETAVPTAQPTETAAQCTCGAAEGEAHKEGCQLYAKPAPDDFKHMGTCTKDCTDAECKCPCHLFNKIMACTTLEEIEAMIEATPEDVLRSLSEEQIAQVEAHMEALMPAPLPAIVIEASEPPVESEICRATVNYTDVAPFGEPVTGGEN